MNEHRGVERSGNAEKSTGSKLPARSLGKAALVLAGYWSAKSLAPMARNLIDRLDIAEHDTLEQNVNIFKSLAESFGVDVQEEHLEYWRTMWAVTRALDTIIDKTHPESLSNEVGALLSGDPIPGLSSDEAEKFHSYVTNASDKRHDTIMAGFDVSGITERMCTTSDPEEISRLRREEGEIFARKISEITERIRVTSDPMEMLRLRREEAKLYSRIMILDNPDLDPAIEAFNGSLINLSEVAYEVDSLADLAHDFKSGVTTVPPTLANYIAIGREVLQDGYGSLSQLPKRTLAGLAITGLRKAARMALAARAPRQQD